MLSRVMCAVALAIALSTPAWAQGRGAGPDRFAPPPTTPQAKSLYERLGGADAINAAAEGYRKSVQDDFDIPARDRPTAAYLITDLLGRLCKTNGKGNCLYEGTDDPPLKSLLKVSTRGFEALVKGMATHLGNVGANAADVAEAVRKMHEVQYYLVDTHLDLLVEMDQ